MSATSLVLSHSTSSQVTAPSATLTVTSVSVLLSSELSCASAAASFCRVAESSELLLSEESLLVVSELDAVETGTDFWELSPTAVETHDDTEKMMTMVSTRATAMPTVRNACTGSAKKSEIASLRLERPRVCVPRRLTLLRLDEGCWRLRTFGLPVGAMSRELCLPAAVDAARYGRASFPKPRSSSKSEVSTGMVLMLSNDS